jgi:hypothetical protein
MIMVNGQYGSQRESLSCSFSSYSGSMATCQAGKKLIVSSAEIHAVPCGINSLAQSLAAASASGLDRFDSPLVGVVTDQLHLQMILVVCDESPFVHI